MICPTDALINIQNYRTMTPERFCDVEKQRASYPSINVIPIRENEWAIFGTDGVYESPEQKRTFPLSDVHQLLNTWRIAQFFQDGELKEFPT